MDEFTKYYIAVCKCVKSKRILDHSDFIAVRMKYRDSYFILKDRATGFYNLYIKDSLFSFIINNSKCPLIFNENDLDIINEE